MSRRASGVRHRGRQRVACTATIDDAHPRSPGGGDSGRSAAGPAAADASFASPAFPTDGSRRRHRDCRTRPLAVRSLCAGVCTAGKRSNGEQNSTQPTRSSHRCRVNLTRQTRAAAPTQSCRASGRQDLESRAAWRGRALAAARIAESAPRHQPPHRTRSARGESATGARGTSPLVVNGGTLRFVSISGARSSWDARRGRGVLGRRKGTQGSHRSGFSDECHGSDASVLGGHDGRESSDFNAAQQPVENVSWQDATKFVARLNQRGDGFTYRLPQETEWEYAARANGGTPEQLSSVAWFGLLASAGSAARPSDVARKRPNAFGSSTCSATSRNGVRTGSVRTISALSVAAPGRTARPPCASQRVARPFQPRGPIQSAYASFERLPAPDQTFTVLHSPANLRPHPAS